MSPPTPVIAGRYELGDRLGFGGMSTVQIAMDRRLERHVAVKLLAEHLAEDDQFVTRFRREALSAARLVHPNIVQVFDFGLDEPTGRHYIVMEYIRGQSGAEILRDHKRLGGPEALALLDGACRGLHHAHRNGTVHRDVKPGNILRSDEGAVKVADFGIAKAAMDSTSAITQVGSVLGTAAYLAPEQAAGEEATPRSDIYGLGVVAYQFLAGRLPYDAGTLSELVLLQQREEPPPLDAANPEVNPALAAAVARALALEPAERYADMEELRAALQAGARGAFPEQTGATQVVASGGRDRTGPTRAIASSPPAPARRLEPLPPPSGPQGAPARAAAREAERGARPPRRKANWGRRLVIALILGLVAAAVIIAVLGAQPQDAVQLREITGDGVGDIVDQVQSLVDDNTR